jgi:DNA-binding NarL/FixJ family response regulator
MQEKHAISWLKEDISMPISVLLVDDHIVYRNSLRVLLEAVTDFSIVGEAGDGLDSLTLATRLCPDVVIMDYMMPVMNGVEATGRLRQQQPNLHVVLLSLHDDKANVVAAIRNGASAYILKEDVVTHLAQAVAAAHAGQFYFSPSIRNRPYLSELLKKHGDENKSLD